MGEGGPVEQEEAGDQAAASQLHTMAQPRSQLQPAASHSQEAQEATEWVADSSAHTAGLSSGDGGRYLSVAPSSLWGPPAGAVVTTPSPATVETASGEPAPGVDRTAAAFSTDAIDGATSSADKSAREDLSGSPSSEPATRAGLAPGMHFI